MVTEKVYRYVLVLSVAAAALLPVSCSSEADRDGSDQTGQPNTADTLTGTAGEEEKTEEGLRTIEIVGTDQMKFTVRERDDGMVTGDTIAFDNRKFLLLNEITAAPGERIQIRLETLSHFDSTMMSHNWVLLARGVDAQKFANAANREDDYMTSMGDDRVLAHTTLAADGETAAVTFTAPEQTGRYSYICSFMAHYPAGMAGELVVKPGPEER